MPHDAQAPDPLALLTAPGGRGRLQREGDVLVAEDGRRFPVRGGVALMLGEVGAALGTELETQAIGLTNYLDERLFITRYERDVAQRVRELLGDAGGPIVDAGCGIGLIGRLFPELGLYGVDASGVLLAQADTGYAARAECNAEELPFADGSVGAVLAVNMLHHMERPAAAVREFARILRPGGVLVAVDPRSVGAIELAKRVLRAGDPAYAPTHRAFGVGEYRELLGGGSFALERFERRGCAALVVGGGLDAVGLSRVLPPGAPILAALKACDALLDRLPGGATLGLNLYARARRVG
jgi:SAM-dependent methyltransferase